MIRPGVLPRLAGSLLLIPLILIWAGASPVDAGPGPTSAPGRIQPPDDEGLGPPPLYDAIREAPVSPAGQIRDGRLQIDRFELELIEGELYLAPAIDGVVSTAVYLGDGVVRAYPPDAVEHHQLEKLSDAHHLEAEFERLVVRSTDDTAERLRSLATPGSTPRGRGTDQADRLVRRRREARLEHQGDNPDSRVLEDLLRRQAGALPAGRAYVMAELDTKDHGWVTILVEPTEREEVQLYRHDERRRITDSWMRFDLLGDYAPDHAAAALDGFAVDPSALDEDELNGVALGLPARPIQPDREGWTARVTVPRTQVDLALEGDGDTRGTAALLMDPLEPTRGLRVRISPVLEVTDVRWRPPPLAAQSDPGVWPSSGGVGPDVDSEPDAPRALTGERLHFVQARHDRLLDDDQFEPWVTVALPRTVAPHERFVLEVAYEGKLVARTRRTNEFWLKDTLYWHPRHPDNRRSQLDLTFRMPDRYRVASAGALVEERVEAGTRIMRWVTSEPVRTMAFHYGQFEVTDVTRAIRPAVAVYANENHVGFAPGNREKTIADLTGAIDIFARYFGPFPFESLLVTETATLSGQAFPGLLLLSYQTFGELPTGESELFRSHEVAHQWWGAAIDWEDYRDQWMTEGFAQYAAALYALQGLQRPDQFEDMLDAWRLDVLGEGRVGQGLGLRHYGFNPEVLRRSDGHESGALVVGYRLNSTDTPFDYRVLVYEKGAFILHMLRAMLLDLDTGNDGRFQQLMWSYADAHVGGVMSTGSFEAAVERVFGEPMAWFFDQWVYGVEIPSYRPELSVSPMDDDQYPFVLHGSVTQTGVPDSFKMPVPVRLTFEDRPPLTHRIWVDAPEVRVELPLPARPNRIEFNAGQAVLARVR